MAQSTALKPLFNQIVDAIHEKDGLSDGIAAIDFPDRIRKIPSGGTSTGPLDPEQVYRETRPADWLPMPSLIKADEMYLLCLVPDGGTLQVGFTATCTGSYLVQLGTVVDGQFAEAASSTVESGTAYEAEISAADYGDLTSDGYKQVMVRVSGTEIKTWTPNYYGGIVDISCRLPSGTKVKCGDHSSASKALTGLKYFSWYGKNEITDATSMFRNCTGLVCIRSLYAAKVTNATAMFASCNHLTALPAIEFSSLTAAQYMFNYSDAIEDISHLKMPMVSSLYGAFSYCDELIAPPDFMYSQINNIGWAFNRCRALRSIENLNLSPSTKTDNYSFKSLASIKRFTFDPSMQDCNTINLPLANAKMEHSAIVELLRSLPVSTTGSSLTLTGNPGAAAVTEEEKAIATGKNWTLTL